MGVRVIEKSGKSFFDYKRPTRDVIERILGIKCCATCRRFDPETGICHIEDYPDIKVVEWWKTRSKRKFVGADCFAWE